MMMIPIVKIATLIIFSRVVLFLGTWNKPLCSMMIELIISPIILKLTVNPGPIVGFKIVMHRTKDAPIEDAAHAVPDRTPDTNLPGVSSRFTLTTIKSNNVPNKNAINDDAIEAVNAAEFWNSVVSWSNVPRLPLNIP